jgi:two-component system, OmpR family, phosphate regulon sensor histidine kinase PhoR
MNKFRFRMLNALLIVMAVMFISVALLLENLLKGLYVNDYADQLAREAAFVETLLHEKEWLTSNLPLLVHKLNKNQVGMVRIFFNDRTMINEEGIQQKAPVELGELERLSKEEPLDQHNDKLQYTIAFTVEGEQAFLQFSLSKSVVQNSYHKLRIVIFTCLSIGFIVTVLMSVRIMHRLTMPLADATRVANELAHGNFNARTYDDQLDETGQLSESINVLARNLQEMTNSYIAQQNRLFTLIENMGSALILIDSKGYINLVNRTYKEMFKVNTTEWFNKIYYHVLTQKEIIKVIEETFMTESKVHKQILLSVHIERKHFDINSTPIIDNDGKLKGVVLVFHDITELKNLEQMRKDFVANVSHELRTPVTSLKGFAETLLDGAMEDETLRKQFLTIMLEESERLQTLIQDLLDLSKIEQKGISLNWDLVNLKQNIEDVLVMLKEKADHKKLNVTFNVKGNTVISGDTYRLKQVFINLINNSITYTLNGGSIHIGLTESNDSVTFTISDTGIGIPEEEIPRIFERFYRVDRARSRNSGGTGLGLAIVKHIVEAHEGEIKVESKLGTGTTFTLVFKKRKN